MPLQDHLGLTCRPGGGRAARLPLARLTLVLLVSFVSLTFAQDVEDIGLTPPQLEDRLLSWVNQERERAGLQRLRVDERLRQVARAHSEKMARQNSVSHDFPGYPALAERLADAGVYFARVGENVAGGKTFVMRLVHESLMNSPGHRANIVRRDVDHIGIGIARSDDTYYVTEEFAALFEPRPVDAVESSIADALTLRFGAPSKAVPPLADLLRGSCRELARQYLVGAAATHTPPAYGQERVYALTFVELDAGVTQILDAAGETAPLAWAVGVAFGRSTSNPGGAYSVAVASFPDLRPAGVRPEDAVLDAVNRARASHGARELATDSRLEWVAARSADEYFRDATFTPTTDASVAIAFDTRSLATLPDGVVDRICRRADLRRIGIRVLYPLALGVPRNVFVVAIAAR